MKGKKEKVLSEVGFEPTPSDEDQKALSLSVSKVHLESGALDRSAILTLYKHCKIGSSKVKGTLISSLFVKKN